MIPWEHIDEARVPGSSLILSLQRRGEEYSLRIDRAELMNSRRHESEEALADLALAELRGGPKAPAVLIGGLGMGFTLRAALDRLPPRASVTVAELVPQVVTWNHEHMGHLAGHPLKDPRVKVHMGDVAELLRRSAGKWDAVLLDTDNGPEGTTRDENEHLYSRAGLASLAGSLRPGGVLGVWSAFSGGQFVQRLAQTGLDVKEHRVRARKSRDSRHMVWVARKS